MKREREGSNCHSYSGLTTKQRSRDQAECRPGTGRKAKKTGPAETGPVFFFDLLLAIFS
jgi:hypothetical protein